jgi:hypothetical protein
VTEKELYRQLQVKVAPPLTAEVNTVEFSEGLSLVVNGKVVCHQVRGGVTLEEKVPEVFEVNPQSMAALL